MQIYYAMTHLQCHKLGLRRLFCLPADFTLYATPKNPPRIFALHQRLNILSLRPSNPNLFSFLLLSRSSNTSG